MVEKVAVTNLEEVSYYIGDYSSELSDIKRALEDIKEILQRIERKT